MITIVVMSDNHGQDTMLEYLQKREPYANYYVYCGDSEAMFKELLTEYISVKGNSDWALDLPMEIKFTIEGYHILLTGHTHITMFKQDN